MKKNTLSSILGVLIISSMLSLSGPIAAFAAGPASVDLISAGSFALLSKTGITDTGSHATVITGNIGSSPITAAAMNGVFCSEMVGTIYGVDAAYVGSGSQTCFQGNPPVANKTLIDNAVLDMGAAYNDVANRTNPTATELGAGNIGGMTLAPGLYKWSTDVSIPTNVTLSGSANDVWIFQIAGNLTIASAGSVPSGIKVVLVGGAKASNVFWQVGGGTGATLGTYSTFNGNILSAKQVIIQTGAVLNGRALAQTQVTLDANVISLPFAPVQGTSATTNTQVTQAVTTTQVTQPNIFGGVSIALAIPVIHIVKTSSQANSLPFGGGSVVYAYVVTNPGIVSMHDIVVTDDKCGPVFGPEGDFNHNGLLDPGESWDYACIANIFTTTTNTGAAQGQANNYISRSTATATVFVSTPGFPNTGLAPETN